MGDEQYNDSWVRFVNPIHNPPIADTIAKMARQRASQAPDIRMLERIHCKRSKQRLSLLTKESSAFS
jgi:hypothetical protein